MRILLAEKDPDICLIVTTRLTARHHEVIEISKSEEVLHFLERESVELVLLSADMERIGSVHLIERIRRRPHLMTIPIILLTDENKISELLMSQDRGFDDFLIKPFNPLVLQLRVTMNVTRSRHRIEANALTHLPGNHAIERVILKKIERNEKFSVLYIDINHFKSFNDLYGFDKGDEVICQTAKLLVRMAEKHSSDREYFIGHIGGDDFVAILDPEREEAFARAFIAEFDRIMPTYYNDSDQKRGGVRVTNRRGKRETFPLMSCSVSVVTNLYRSYKNLGEIAQDAAEVKSFLKSQPGSHYLRDRRSSPAPALDEAMQILAPELPETKQQNAEQEMDPLGQILVNAGLITEDQLSAALKRHLETGQRLGQALISMSVIKSEDVGRMLEKKLNVPYISLSKVQPGRDTLRIFTMDFIKSHRVVAVEKTATMLKLAMCDPFDLQTLDSIERITGLKPVPALALEDEFETFLESQSALNLEKNGI